MKNKGTKDKKRGSVCQECGMTIDIQFHPIESCILVKAQYNPEAYLLSYERWKGRAGLVASAK